MIWSLKGHRVDQKYLNILTQGVEAWNRWRKEHTDIRPDLSHADLRRANLSYANLMEAHLREALRPAWRLRLQRGQQGLRLRAGYLGAQARHLRPGLSHRRR